MLPELLAILGSFIFGLGLVLARKGLVKSNFLSATANVNLIGTIVFCILSLLLVPLNNVNPIGIALFALAGLVVGFVNLF